MNRCATNSADKLRRQWLKSLALEEKSTRGITVAESLIEIRLKDMRESFPTPALKKYPPILLLHQIANGLRINEIEHDTDKLRRLGKIFIFTLPIRKAAEAVVFMDDLIKWFEDRFILKRRIKFFFLNIVPKLPDWNVTKEELMNLKLTELDIKDLINFGLLFFVRESFYGLTIPCAGEFAKIFVKGRFALINALKKSPEKELLKIDIASRRSLQNSLVLGIDYHIADIVGIKLADSVDTTQGPLIRFGSTI